MGKVRTVIHSFFALKDRIVQSNLFMQAPTRYALLLEVKLFGAEVLTTILPDGPALRATALITYANWLVANSNKTFVTTTLWPIIKLDLDYVMNLWNQTT